MGGELEWYEAKDDFLKLELVGGEAVSTDVSTEWGDDISFYGTLLAFHVENISDELWKWNADHFMDVIDTDGFSNQLSQSKITDLELPNPWKGYQSEIQPGQKIKYLAFVDGAHDPYKVRYNRKVLSATYQSDRDRSERVQGQENLEISLEEKSIQEIDDLPVEVQELFVETDSIAKEKPPTQVTDIDLSEYNEVSSDYLPIKLNVEGSGNQLLDFVRETQPHDAQFAVYVLKCMKPRISDFTQHVNSYYSQDFDKEELKEQVRERWRITRSDQDWTQEELLETVEKELNRGRDPIDALKWPTYVLEADHLYYVGSTNDLVRRIREHQTGQGAVFTELVPPQSLNRVFWFEGEKEAKRAERKVAIELTTLVNEERENPRDNPSLRLRSWADGETRVFAYMF